MRLSLMNKKGMTLVEAMIALFIMAIVLTGMMGAFIVGKMGLIRVRNRSIAMNLLRGKMEEKKTQKLADIYNEVIENADVAVGDPLINDTMRVLPPDNGKVTVIYNWNKVGWGGTMTKGDVDNPDLELVTYKSN
ncbi:MAG: type II secretion system protein [Candidatus Aadella gelida]|nr:type II secretion system protein [Candidatus Aadella gelida]